MLQLRRPRILHMVGAGGDGGLGRVVFDLIELQRDSFDFAAVVLGASGLAAELASLGVRVFPAAGAPPSKLALLRGLFEAFRVFAPDIVHSHMNMTHMYCGPPALLRGCKLCLHHHAFQPITWRQSRHRIAYRALWRMGAHGVAVSMQVAREFEAATGITGTSVIYNGIDIDRFTPRLGRGGEDREIKVISVGRLSPGKRFDILIEAARIVADALPQVRFLIVGDGDQRAELEEQAAKGLPDDAIRLLGHRTDVPDILRGARVFAMSSDAEGLPLSVIEAMACGLPVVATAVGGLQELVRHGENGFLVPAGRPDELAKALIRVLRDPGLATRMGRAGLERAHEQFDRRRMADEVAAVYERLLAG